MCVWVCVPLFETPPPTYVFTQQTTIIVHLTNCPSPINMSIILAGVYYTLIVQALICAVLLVPLFVSWKVRP